MCITLLIMTTLLTWELPLRPHRVVIISSYLSAPTTPEPPFLVSIFCLVVGAGKIGLVAVKLADG